VVRATSALTPASLSAGIEAIGRSADSYERLEIPLWQRAEWHQ
jgi:hypothetical protein